MIFTEFRFLFFFLTVFAVYWALPGNRARKLWLLGASYTFYAAWDWRFLSLILISTAVDYRVGLTLDRTADEALRRRLLQVSMVVNLGLLGAFKYFNFFYEAGVDLLSVLGIPVNEHVFSIVLPVGISFYTFQTMSYTLDIYARKLKATPDAADLALFVGFFPQLVAGPIVRARDFLPQLSTARRFCDVRVRDACMLFVVGLVKKAVVSDSVSPYVDSYFASPEIYDSVSSWIGVSLYSVQIYCDFSGYSDMAIACAALLGYRLPVNFRFPYFAQNITDFWRRWHISLSTWLRDYLYIPLGGNRGSRLFVYRNVMLTMLLGGLWHGAHWRFVIWGGLHGIALIVHREWTRRYPGSSRAANVGALLGTVLTFYWVGLAWIFFRAESLEAAWVIARAYLMVGAEGGQLLGDRLLWVFALLALAHLAAWRGWARGWWTSMPRWAFAACYGALCGLTAALMHANAKPFIYFQF